MTHSIILLDDTGKAHTRIDSVLFSEQLIAELFDVIDSQISYLCKDTDNFDLQDVAYLLNNARSLFIDTTKKHNSNLVVQ